MSGPDPPYSQPNPTVQDVHAPPVSSASLHVADIMSMPQEKNGKLTIYIDCGQSQYSFCSHYTY